VLLSNKYPMQENDYVKQNAGAHQGNLHHDSDNGKNPTGMPGSTLGKSDPLKHENETSTDEEQMLQTVKKETSRQEDEIPGNDNETIGNP
jgi:hypothetical protein